MPTPLSQLGENAVLARLLQQLTTQAPMLTGPGDDCAVVARDSEWDTLLKTDVVVESVHFTPDTDPERVGHKALARAVSDIAAMGGLPEFALVIVAGGVDDDHGTQGQQLHGFLDRVRGGALGIGNYGEFLTGNGVYYAGFAGVAAAEKAYMHTLG